MRNLERSLSLPLYYDVVKNSWYCNTDMNELDGKFGNKQDPILWLVTEKTFGTARGK